MTRLTAHPRRRRAYLFAGIVCGIAALTFAAFGSHRSRVVYNPSNSVPVGWYRIETATALSVGDIVLVNLPPQSALFAAHRGYLPAHIPLLKSIAALPPQRVCMEGSQLRIDGIPTAVALRADHRSRPLPIWRHCRRLSEGEIFVASTHNPWSFDSRYFGPVTVADVLGKAHKF
ncbi:MAG: S26 family signal peptidase [Janthinobacterium lividum]